MQASELWSGTEYAYMDGRPKGVETPMYCQRIRVLRVFKEKADTWADRMTTYATVEILDKDDNVINQKTVRARDIVDFWDEYKDRYDHIMALRKKDEEERAARRAEEAKKREEMLDFFQSKMGIRPEQVSVYYDTIQVTFKKGALYPDES